MRSKSVATDEVCAAAATVVKVFYTVSAAQ
jgi:hypothetical protein